VWWFTALCLGGGSLRCVWVVVHCVVFGWWFTALCLGGGSLHCVWVVVHYIAPATHRAY